MKLLKDKKILVISSEVVPYLPQTEKAVNSFSVSRKINVNGGMTRIFMPKYGMINERRHQLHEVIRLSGMNMLINDLYMPLIIKVASIPKERMQVYFIDNEEYFKRKEICHASRIVPIGVRVPRLSLRVVTLVHVAEFNFVKSLFSPFLSKCR